MPTMILLVDNTVPVAADFNSNYTALNQVCGTTTSITGYTAGDMLYASGATALSKLAVATLPIQFMTAPVSSAPQWGFIGGHLHGLTMSNGTDATNDIDIAIGEATSQDTSVTSSRCLMQLTTALTKQLDAAWAVGTNAGGLDEGTIANVTYHVHLIERTDTGVVDALFSQAPGNTATITVTIASPGVVTWTGHGLQAGAGVVFTTTGALPTGITSGTRYYVISASLAADSFQFSTSAGGAAVNTSGSQSGTHTGTSNPAFPTNYTKRRRIGSILRESAAIVAFTQAGDLFMRATGILDVDVSNPGTNAVTRTLSVPTGSNVLVMANWHFIDGTFAANSLYVSDLALTDSAASLSVAPLASFAADGDAATGILGSAVMLVTRANRSAQVRSRIRQSGASTGLRVATVGWVDRRGRDA